ncbi:MAG: SUMF1/EgtB/PvdO family nonheme iron enzyme [Desulfobacterales bacterium]|nr:SUMF1/EgtB/PvdO family nonheme iron enzyme [Desulfobacterales bacterium]
MFHNSVIQYEVGQKIFKDFTWCEYLGSGSFGKVYRVENDKNISFALKILDRRPAQLFTEIENIKHIKSARLISIIDYGKSIQNEYCILMEYIDANLDKVLEENKDGLQETQAVKYFKEILKGLIILETNSIQHNNIKPSNLFILDDIVKIGDSGTAPFVSKSRTDIRQPISILNYITPEEIEEITTHKPQAVSHYWYNDCWAAAVIFYRMLTGQFPFTGENIKSIFDAIMNQNIDLSIVPYNYRSFLANIFKKNIEERVYKSLRDMVLSFNNISDSDEITVITTNKKNNLKHKQTWRVSSKPLRFSYEMEFVYIPAGEFIMGSPENEDARTENEYQHNIIFSKGFYIQTKLVTQAQWKKVMGNNPSFFEKSGDTFPIENVSWNSIQEFIHKVNEYEEHNKYRLPTEAEWEYACRAGTTTPFYFGETISSDQANYNGNYPYQCTNKGEYRCKTTPVGIFPPNDFGLYDMHGNVWEWCLDIYSDDSYKLNQPNNPVYINDGLYDIYTTNSSELYSDEYAFRVVRGGSWANSGRYCRSSNRDCNIPYDSDSVLGFRLVRIE